MPRSSEEEDITEVQRKEDFESAMVEPLSNHGHLIKENAKRIDNSFEQLTNSEADLRDTGTLFESISIVFVPELDEEARSDLAEAIVNFIASADPELVESLSEKIDDEEMLNILVDLKNKHNKNLINLINKLRMGENWWHNLSTNIGFRSGEPNLKTEISQGTGETVVIDNDMRSFLFLINHFVENINQAHHLLGEDVLDEINEEIVENVEDNFEEFRACHRIHLIASHSPVRFLARSW